MSEELAYFVVVRVWFSVSMTDPHINPNEAQYHHGIFVRRRKDGFGTLHHAVGDVTSQGGMRYEVKDRDDITRSQTYAAQQILGYIPKSSYAALAQALRSCQTPPQQKAFNKQRMATEPFKTPQPLTFYSTDELKNFQFPRLMKCKWWVEQQAIVQVNQFPSLVQNPPST